MEKLSLITELSPWLMLVVVILAGGLSFLLYQRGNVIPLKWRRVLGVIRFIIFTLIGLLLIGPLLKTIRNTYVEPVWVIALDNSESIAYSADTSRIKTLIDKFEANDTDYLTIFRSIDESTDFSAGNSDLYNLIKKIETEFYNANLAGIVLVSDGIYNQGISPAFGSYSVPVYTVGVGDTLPKQDLIVRNLRYNRTVYQGNKFQLEAQVAAEGFQNNITTTIRILNNGKTIKQKQLTMEPEGFQEVIFELDASTEGQQRYIVQIDQVENEFLRQNNEQSAYIEVIEGTDNVLIASTSPHPDIRAITTVLNKNANYTIHLFIPGIHPFSPDQYDIIIFHHCTYNSTGMNPVKAITDFETIPKWYIYGSGTNIRELSSTAKSFNFAGSTYQKDRVKSTLNTSFTGFNLDENFTEKLAVYPPLLTPYGESQLSPIASAILYQKIGKIETNRPLWWIYEDGPVKEGVTLGEGIWRWPLAEYARYNTSISFETLVQKTIQYLSTRQDRRKFRVYPRESTLGAGQIDMETELYNNLYEPVYDEMVQLRVRSSDSASYNYEYILRPGKTIYTIDNLPEGVYSFDATTRFNGNNYSDNGQFVVEYRNLELTRLTADFNLLKTISRESEGAFFIMDESSQLMETMKNNTPPSDIVSSERYSSAVEFPWIFFLIVALITVEWASRRWMGTY